MTIQPVKVQPSQIWHVKQCKSKVHSKKTPCAQIKQDHSFTKKSHEHKTEKVLSKKFFTYYIPSIQNFHSLFSQNSKNKNIRSLLLRSFSYVCILKS